MFVVLLVVIETWEGVIVGAQGDKVGERHQPDADPKEAGDAHEVVILVGKVLEPHKVIH